MADLRLYALETQKRFFDETRLQKRQFSVNSISESMHIEGLFSIGRRIPIGSNLLCNTKPMSNDQNPKLSVIQETADKENQFQGC